MRRTRRKLNPPTPAPSVDTKALRALSKTCGPAEESRYSINLIQLKGRNAYATNGHMAARLESLADAVASPIFIDPAGFKPTAMTLTIDGERLELRAGTSLIVSAEEVEKRKLVFPDIDKILDPALEVRKPARILLDAKYLKAAIEIVIATGARSVEIRLNADHVAAAEKYESSVVLIPRDLRRNDQKYLSGKDAIVLMPKRMS